MILCTFKGEIIIKRNFKIHETSSIYYLICKLTLQIIQNE